MKTASLTFRLPENAAAFADLEARRQALFAVAGVRTENVPAGAGNGSAGIYAAIEELQESMASLVRTDLVEGRRWTH
jgi:hypothetical protein